MGLVNVPKIIDYRNRVARHASKKYVNRTNGIKSITDIAIHHSLTLRKLAGSTAEGYARYHVNSLGWPGIGYTYVIEADGTIKYVNDLAKKTYHVGNHNNYAVGIVLSGDFSKEEPTKAQAASLRQLVAALKDKYPHVKNVKGHSDYVGYEWKACPVFDYKKVLDGKVEKPIKPSNKPKPNPKPKPEETSKPKANLKVDGYWGKEVSKALQRCFSTPVDGFLSGQKRNAVTNALYGSTAKFANGGSMVIKALQRLLNEHGASLKVDGLLGPATILALQKYLLTTEDGKLSRPSLVVKALQRALNAGVL